MDNTNQSKVGLELKLSREGLENIKKKKEKLSHDVKRPSGCYKSHTFEVNKKNAFHANSQFSGEHFL